MQQDDKVDLTSVNKTKKQFKLPVLKNPFKKQVGPKRDEVGKFTSGSGGLLSNKKFNFKRAIPLVAVVALVGGFFVFRSFAAVTKPPIYQYSISTCKNSGNKPATKDTTCQDQSAEAMVFRMYTAAYGRNPDQGGYKQHTQMLAGDRIKRENVASAFVNSQEFKNLKISSNKAFVEHLYKKLLKRDTKYTAPATDTWVKALDSNKMSRTTVFTLIAQTQEAQSKTRADFIKYSGSAPKFAIVQTAQQKQTARNKESAQLAVKAKIHSDGSYNHLKLARPLSGKAGAQAAAANQNNSTLTAINNYKNQAQKNLQNAQGSAKNANDQYLKAEAIFKSAKAVSQYSPDIPSSSVENARNQAAMLAGKAKSDVSEINNIINQINGSYTTAQSKFKAEQARIAAEQARKAAEQAKKSAGAGGGFGGSSGGTQDQASTPIANGAVPVSGGNCKEGYVKRSDTCQQTYAHPTKNPGCVTGSIAKQALSQTSSYPGGYRYKYTCKSSGKPAVVNNVSCTANYSRVEARDSSNFYWQYCKRK